MLLVSKEFYDQVRQTALSAKSNIFITSAFVKVKAIEALLENIPSDVVVEITGRWRKNDLLVKASDLEVYKLCRKNGWRFGIDQNLHGKLYLVDNKDVFLGSANLTQKGMSLGGFSNVEFGTAFDAEQLDINRISAYKQNQVVWMDDELFALIETDINQISDSSSLENGDWSKEILSALETPLEYLWVHELLFVSPKKLLRPNLDDESTLHDFDMLNLHCDNLDVENLSLIHI